MYVTGVEPEALVEASTYDSFPGLSVYEPEFLRPPGAVPGSMEGKSRDFRGVLFELSCLVETLGPALRRRFLKDRAALLDLERRR